MLYGNVDNIIKCGDNNYKNLVAVFEKAIDDNNKSWVDDVNDFIKLGKEKNGMFSQDLNGQEFSIKSCEVKYDNENNSVKEAIVNNSYKKIFEIKWDSELAIADFLLDIIKTRYDQGIEITTEEILELSEKISDEDIKIKFKLCSFNFLFKQVEIPDVCNFNNMGKRCYKFYKETAQNKQKYIENLFKNDNQRTKLLAISLLYSFPGLESDYKTEFTKPICANIFEFKKFVDNGVENRTDSENLFRDKLNKEEIDLYRNSFISMDFIFSFLFKETDELLEKEEKPWECRFDSTSYYLFELLKKVPVEAKIKFDPDKLNQDQKYILVTSLLDNFYENAAETGKNHFLLDTFDFDKYKLNAKTKKILNIYFENKIKSKIVNECNLIDESLGELEDKLDDLEDQINKPELLENQISALEKQKNAINKFLSIKETFENHILNVLKSVSIENYGKENFDFENLLNINITDEIDSTIKEMLVDMVRKLDNKLLHNYESKSIDIQFYLTNLKYNKQLLEDKLTKLKSITAQPSIDLQEKKNSLEDQIKTESDKKNNLGIESVWPAILSFPILPLSIFLFVQYLKNRRSRETYENNISDLEKRKNAIKSQLFDKISKNQAEIKKTETDLETLNVSIEKKEKDYKSFIDNASGALMKEFNGHIKLFESKYKNLEEKISQLSNEKQNAEKYLSGYDKLFNKTQISVLKDELEEIKQRISSNKFRISSYDDFSKKVSDGLDIKKNKIEKKHPFGMIEKKKAEGQKELQTGNKKDFTK